MDVDNVAADEDASKTAEIKLHVGGVEPKEGWMIVNIMDGPHVDVLGSTTDLSPFGDATVSTIYASHILEHLSYQHELIQALREFARVLKPGGQLMVSVPNLEVLCRLYMMPGVSLDHRFFVMRMIFGGQVDDYDYHKTGFDFATMKHFMEHVGFHGCKRVESHGLFNDTSDKEMLGTRISLNMVATR